MSQHYSDPERETEETALPDVEVWQSFHQECPDPDCESQILSDGTTQSVACPSCGLISRAVLQSNGWFYWFCFPGCLPDSEPVGPFQTKADALADAQSAND